MTIPPWNRLLRCLTILVLVGCAAIGSTSALPAEENAADAILQAELHAALKQANPNYQNGGTFRIKEGKLTGIFLMRCPGLTDLSPLARFPLSSVHTVGLYKSVNISDLSPLRACPLKQLNLERCDKISDLSPLKGMPLKWFRMYACSSIQDLEPLRGMKLEHLDIGLNPLISDLSPLDGMKLHDLRIDNCPQLTDISVIKEMPLTFLSLFGCPRIKSYEPLTKLPLETLYFNPNLLSKAELQQVRRLASLKKLATTWDDYRKEDNPEQFWQRYDAGEFRELPQP